jgi:hypothetical protein
VLFLLGQFSAQRQGTSRLTPANLHVASGGDAPLPVGLDAAKAAMGMFGARRRSMARLRSA